MSINGTLVTRTYEVGGLIGNSGTTMDVGQAMSLLGFPSTQTFESTSMEEINSAFTYRMHLVVKASKIHFSNREVALYSKTSES